MSNELIRQTVLSGTDIRNDFRKTAKPEPTSSDTAALIRREFILYLPAPSIAAAWKICT